MHHVKAELLQQAAGVLELCLCLARKADYHVGGQRHVGYAGPDALNKCPILGHGVAPPHPPQHLIIARLHRQLKVLAHPGQLRHRLDELRVNISRMGSQEPDAV